MPFSFVCPSLSLVRFRHPITLLRYADKGIVSKMKVYIERNNLQVELIRYRNNIDFIHVYFCEATHSMQYCPHIREYRTCVELTENDITVTVARTTTEQQ